MSNSLHGRRAQQPKQKHKHRAIDRSIQQQQPEQGSKEEQQAPKQASKPHPETQREEEVD